MMRRMLSVYRALPPSPEEAACGTMTVEDATLALAINSLAAAIGSVSSLTAAAIAMAVVIKTHASQAHRIFLYLAIVSLLDRIVFGMEVLPIKFEVLGNTSLVTLLNQSGWEDACAAIGFVSQYLSLSKSLALLWLCLYVFALAILRVHLQLVRHEVAGLLCISLIPLVIVWIPFLSNGYGLGGTWCWIKDSCNGTSVQYSWYKIGVGDIPFLLAHVTSLVLIATTIGVFCKRSRTNDHLRQCQQTALKKLLPLLLYPALFSVAAIVTVFKDVSFFAAKFRGRNDAFAAEMAVVVVIQTFTVALPVSLLLNSDVRSTLCRKRKTKAMRSSGVKTYNQDGLISETSTTFFKVKHETSENDPLVTIQVV